MKTAGLVRTTYEIITPESAEHGDVAEEGFIDEDGQECTPEEAFNMVEGCEPSASDFTGGVWYTDNEYHTDYKTGAQESRSYHLKGFTPRQERLIFDSVDAGHWQGDEEDEALDAQEAEAPVENPNQLKLFESAAKLIQAARQLLASDDYSEEELAALSVMGMNKPSYRAVEFERVGLGEYTKDSPVLKSLVAKGLVKFTATGIQLDKPLAVAVMKRHLAPEKYKGQLSNTSMQFKRKEEPDEEDDSPMDVSAGAAWDRAKGAHALIAMARTLLAADGDLARGDTWRLKLQGREKLMLEELPAQGLKQVRRSGMDTMSGRGWVGLDDLIPHNLVMDAKLVPSDSFDAVKQKLSVAAKAAAKKDVAKMEDPSKWDWMLKPGHFEFRDEKPVASHAHEPDDTKPLTVDGKDFTLKCTWEKFSAYDPGADFQSHDPTYSVVQSTSDSQARKLYKILSKDPQALSAVSWSKLPEWLKSKGIASKTNHSVYR